MCCLSNDTIIKQIQDNIIVFNDKICISGAYGDYSYSDLWQMTIHMADSIAKTVGKEQKVIMVICENPLQVIVSLLSIMLSGNIYLPVLNTTPIKRIKEIVVDCRVAGYISTTHSLSCDIDFIKFETQIDEPLSDITNYSHSNNIAYIIYTSGTTGKSKGVCVPHSGLLNTIISRNKILKIGSDCCSIVLMGYSFDGFLANVLSPLVAGGRIVLVNSIFDIDEILSTITTYNVNNILCTPSMMRSMVLHDDKEYLKGIKLISLAGEAIPQQLIQQIKQKYSMLKIANEYGPSENSICTSINPSIDSGKEITVGRLIDNVEAMIAPLSEEYGELYLSGAGLARGYINYDDSNSFVNISGKTWYRTGDIASWNNDELVIHGRIDKQVKQHGYRVDLNEISNTVLLYPEIEDCVIIVNNYGSIVAYYVSQKSIFEKELIDYLSSRLNDYMIPKAFHRISSIPYTENGKLDEYNLSKYIIIESKEDSVSSLNSKNHMMKELSLLFGVCLGIEEYRPDYNFFEYGGDSLECLKLIKLLSDKGYVIKEEQFVRCATPRALSEWLVNGELIENTKSNIEPFNDFWFVDCYFTSVLAVLKAYDKPIVPFMRSFNIYDVELNNEYQLLYEKNADYKDIYGYFSLNYEKYRISNEFEFKKTVIGLVRNRYSAFLHVDCYYLPYFKQQYLKRHVEHVLLIIDYDSKNNTCIVLDQINLLSISFNYIVVEVKYIIESMLSDYLDHSSFDEADCVSNFPIDSNQVVNQQKTLLISDSQILFVVQKTINYLFKHPQNTLSVIERLINYFKIEKYISDYYNEIEKSHIIEVWIQNLSQLIMDIVRERKSLSDTLDLLKAIAADCI